MKSDMMTDARSEVPLKYRWTFIGAGEDDGVFPAPGAAGDATPIERLMAQCLRNRGLVESADIESFLNPRLKRLSDPFLLPQMAAAVDRLIPACSGGEPVAIFGDYDVDGVTSCAMLEEALTRHGCRVRAFVPDRQDDGYGLSASGLERCLAEFPARLLMAVDCGSTSGRIIADLKRRGIEVIVLDHHQAPEVPEEAVAVVNPQLAGSGEPCFRELCTAGLAFKLVHALVKRGRELGWNVSDSFDVRTLLDLTALGTVADLVPLTGENRILVSAGLNALAATSRPGLIELKTVAGIRGPVGVYEAGYLLGPRLNAAGRMKSAMAALRLLQTRDGAEARAIAGELNACNQERQATERGIVDEVIESVRRRFEPTEDYVIVEGREDWHLGVVGIVAARVMRQFHRPTVIAGGGTGKWRGSGRSIPGFDLAAAFRECGDLLGAHGGHAVAAGVSLIPEKLDEFRDRLNGIARRDLARDQLQPELKLDAEVRLEDITLESLTRLDTIGPFGSGNPGLQFAVRRVRLDRPVQRMGRGDAHLKLWVTDGSASREVVWWNAEPSRVPPGEFDLAFAPRINVFRGRRSLQFRWLDARSLET